MIRLQDIADMAGVSRTTVSNVINGNTKRVSQETIDKITRILKEQNYVPHMGSVMLSGHGSRIIGVVLGFAVTHGMQALQDSFVGELVGTIQTEAERNGYFVMLIGGEKIDNVVDMASRWNVEGLIILGYDEKRYHQLSRKLNKKMVLIDAYPEGEYTFQNVGVDDYSGGYQVGEYLYSCVVYDVNKDKEKTIYGVPFATNAAGVIYNTEKFEELGLEVPKTWDEFIDVLQKIKDAGEQPLLMTYKDAWTSLAPWNSMAADLAPENFADDRKAGKTTFVGTHEEIAEKYLTLLDYAQDDYMGLSYDDGNKKFANGDAVMIINGNWAISQYRNANPDVKVNMFALPSSNDESQNKVTSGVDVLLGVSKNSSNVDAAKDFVSFMMEKENIQTYIDEQFSFSALKGVEQSDEAVSGVQEDISNGKVANFEDHYYPSGLDMAALVAEFSLNRANGMDDKENIDQFLKKCDEKYDVANVD